MRTTPLVFVILAMIAGACARTPIVRAPAVETDFFATVDPRAERVGPDPANISSFVIPTNYLDACPASPTPLVGQQKSHRARADAIVRAATRWTREVCRCVLEARGPSPTLRGPDSVSFALRTRPTERPRPPDELIFEGRSPYAKCIGAYLKRRPLAPGPGPINIGFKLEIHESRETRRVFDELDGVRPKLRACYAEAPKPHAAVAVQFDITEKGAAQNFELPSASKLGSCIQGVLSSLRFESCATCLIAFEVLPP